MKKKKWGWIASLLLFFVLSGIFTPQASAAAATQKATLRIVSTTDLHGKVSKMYYDSAVERNGCLAQAYSLIEQARKEAGASNTMTVDIGDSMYGYSADYVLGHSAQNTVQPIYKAMSAVGYDAITIGNHDFDYGYSYLKQQLELAGLSDKCVLSNVILADTGKTIWNETKIITKKVQTNKGKKVSVKIGLIGVTTRTMSTVMDCTQELASLPIIQTVSKETEYLKKKGVDVVVALVHSGIGNKTPLDTDDNVVYGLLNTVDDLDAVVAGHRHINYPMEIAENESIYERDNVDADTGMINDTPMTMVKDRGAGIGVIDLNLKINSDGDISISSSSAGVRMVEKDTPVSQKILDAQQAEIKPVDDSLTQIVGNLSENERIDSYFALIEDNYAIQLANEAKISYGLSYTGGEGKTEYASYPVLAMTKYKLNGSYSADDQIDINGTITMKDILNVQMAGHAFNKLYWISGKQLREWLEWSASIYSTSGAKITSDEMLGRLLEERGAATITASDWMDDWGEFAVCDGVCYTIDATQLPRYNKKGKLKNEASHRIVSLTYDGLPVTDDQKFIIVANNLTTADATAGIEEQKVFAEKNQAYLELSDYVAAQQKFGSLSSNVDHNWNVLFMPDANYIVRSSVFSQPQAIIKDWFREVAGYNDTFAYYLAQFIRKDAGEDKEKPLLVISSTSRQETDGPFDIKVQATDASGIKTVKWLPGKQEEDSSLWLTAPDVAQGAFTADSNQVYSVLAEDNAGNKSLKCIEVSNINPLMLPAPTIKKANNRATVITGTARYGTTVYVEAGSNTYEAETAEDGTYTCTVERLDAGMTVKAYCKDAAGKTSAQATMAVVKRGPNTPTIKKLSNTSKNVTGAYADGTSVIAAIVSGKVYCSGKEGQAIYERSDIYNPSYKIVQAEYEQDGKSFTLALPVQNAGKKVNFYALDQAGRKSKKVSVQTADMGPNMPKLEQVCSIEDYIYGNVTNVNESGTVTVTANGEEYTGIVNEDGTFAVQTDGFLECKTVKVQVMDVKDGVARKSLKVSANVISYKDFLDPEDGQLYLEDIYDDMTEITGYAPAGSNTRIIIGSVSEPVELDDDGSFCYELDEPLDAEESVYLLTRTEGSVSGVVEQAVQKSVPNAPVLLDPDLTTESKTVKVFTMETGEVEMEIDGELYATKKKGIYNEQFGGYVYEFKLPKAKKAQKLTFRIISERGVSSKSMSVKRKKYDNKAAD